MKPRDGLLLVVLGIASLGGAGAPEPAEGGGPDAAATLTAEERAWLAAHPVIRLAPHPDYAPVEFFDEQGRYRGITADYFALFEQRLGMRFEVVRLPPEKFVPPYQ